MKLRGREANTQSFPHIELVHIVPISLSNNTLLPTLFGKVDDRLDTRHKSLIEQQF
jgi:hypothetical protein